MYDWNPGSPSPASSPATAIYRARHDPDGTARCSTTVAHALADCLGTDVTEGLALLYDAVDPDALDALFRPRYDGTERTDGQLSFAVLDHWVTVTATGEIAIEPPADDGRF